MIYAVITKVPESGSSGNLALDLDIWISAQAFGGTWDDPPKRLVDAVPDKQIALFIQTPAFHLGELLVMNENDRDQFGRKPSKWFVTCEYFDEIEKAVARVREVTDAG